MSLKSFAFGAILALLATSLPADETGGIQVTDAYARASGPGARAGAAFMVITNPTSTDDRLVAATSDVAVRTMLHTHVETADGVMQMRHDMDGFPIPAEGQHMLMRGGDHVMFIGLTRALTHGDIITVTLTFEQAGDVVVEIPVDLERRGPHAG
ncbi:MAG: copper chaperone PCu(A)C [Rhodobacteraceae bacterium]|nr:copper chaperone PCu(A)C [Paracoccaceae bacterium]